jgi:hypothetical protein
LSTHLRVGLLSSLFSFGFPTIILCAFLVYPFVLHTLPISSSLTRSFWLCLARGTCYEVFHYAGFSNLPSLNLSLDQIFFSATCSQTPSVYVPPLMSETLCHIPVILLIKIKGN